MSVRILLVMSLAAISFIGCAEDEEDSTPVTQADAQTVADTSGVSDTAVTDTAVPADAVVIEDTSSDAGAADAEVTDSAVDVLEDTASLEDVVGDVPTGDATGVADASTTEDASAPEVSVEDAQTGDPVTFSEVYASVFVGLSCGNGYCHGGGAGGFSITDETGTHFALVDQSAISAVCGLTKLVVPGDPESSILWRRLRPIAQDGDDLCAPKMPQGSQGLDDAESQLVYDWIAGGALP